MNQLEPGAELERIPLLGCPVVLAPEVPAGIFVSDDKTHTKTYELPSNRLSRPEAQTALRQTLKIGLAPAQNPIAVPR